MIEKFKLCNLLGQFYIHIHIDQKKELKCRISSKANSM